MRKRRRFYQSDRILFSRKNDNIISEYILKLYENARSHREPEKWLDQAENNISVETKEQFDQAPFMKIILRDARFR